MAHRDASPRTAHAAPPLAYRSALVPVFLDDVNGEAMERAAKLVGPGADIECVFLVIVPPKLPLDTPLAPDEEQRAASVLEAARIAGRRHGLHVRARVLLARDPGPAIATEAERIGADLVYLAQSHMPRSERSLGRIARELLRRRPCRIVIETGAPDADRWPVRRPASRQGGATA